MFGVHSAESVNHFTAQFHWWRHRFGISSQNVPEVDVKQFSGTRQQQIVEVTVADAKQVGDDAVTGAALDVGIHDFGIDAVRSGFARVVLAEEALDGALLSQDLCDGRSLDELNETVATRRR